MTISNRTKNDEQTLTRKDIAECFAVIKMLHPNWQISETNMTNGKSEKEMLINLWLWNLKVYAASDVKKAITVVASNSRFIPKLADILDYLKADSNQNQHIQIGNDPQSEEKRLREYLEPLSDLEKRKFDKRVQDYVISRQGSLNEFEMISATIMIELIGAHKQKGIENDSIDRYLRLQ